MPYPAAMLTLEECRQKRFDIVVQCDLCRSTHLVRLPERRTRFEGRRVADLFEEGVIGCHAHGGIATLLQIRSATEMAQIGAVLESWPTDAVAALQT